MLGIKIENYLYRGPIQPIGEAVRSPETLAEVRSQYFAALHEARNPVYLELGALERNRDALLLADVAHPIQSPETFGQQLHQQKDETSGTMLGIVKAVEDVVVNSRYFETFIPNSYQRTWEMVCRIVKNEDNGAKVAVDYIDKYCTDKQSKQAMRLALDRQLWQRGLVSNGHRRNLEDIKSTLRYVSSKEARDTMRLGLDASAWFTRVQFGHGATSVDIAAAMQGVSSPQIRGAMRIGIDADLWDSLYARKWGDAGDGSVDQTTLNSTSSRKIRRVFSRLLDGGTSEPGANDGTYELLPSSLVIEALSRERDEHGREYR